MPLSKLGPYYLVRELGRGAFGAVYLAKREGLDRQFALKVLIDPDKETLARFELEARVASKLDHPGIVQVVDAGEAAGHVYYVMGYCPGPTLRDRLSAGALPPVEAATLIEAVARAAEHAHSQGVIHRDLKPANVILSEDHGGRPRLTDFGMARDRSLRRSLTRTGDVMGTPAYMSPEQWRGAKGVDARADVYALGVILYHCLAGQRPFPADSFTELSQQVFRGESIPLAEVAPEVPRSLAAICLRAMEARREDRYASAGEFANALAGFLTPDPKTPTQLNRTTVGVLATVSLGLLAAAAVLWATVSRGEATRAPQATPPPTRAATVKVATPTPSLADTSEAPPPQRPRLLAQDDEIADFARLLIEPFRLVKSKGDGLALQTLRGTVPELLDRFPDDPRVQALDEILLLFYSRTNALNSHRRLRALSRSEPPLPPQLLSIAARLSLELGFHRAATELAAQATRPLNQPWAGLTKMHVLITAAPPSQDVEGACSMGEATVALFERLGQTRGDDAHPPIWDVLSNLGTYRLHLGDVAGAVAAMRDGASRTDSQSQREFLSREALKMEQGLSLPAEALEHISVAVGIGSFLKPLVEAAGRTSRPRDPLIAAERVLELSEREPAAELRALTLLRATRCFVYAGELERATGTLESAAQLKLTQRDADVRCLVSRSLAWLLLEQDLDPQRVEALALETIGAQADTTPGEVRDAWTLVVRARLARGDHAGARQALEAARRAPSPDERAVNALAASLR